MRLSLAILVFVMLVLVLPASNLYAASCSIVNEVDYPVRPYSDYNDDRGPFLDKVWFKFIPGGVELCTPTSGPTSCADPAANPSPCDYWKFHLAQDLNANGRDECNDAVYAIADGEVIGFDKSDSTSNFGNYVLIKHRDANGFIFYSFYAHMSEVESGLAAGSCVTTNSIVGRIGKTGFASNCHLHFEIRRQLLDNDTGRGYAHHYETVTLDKYADPESFIRDYGNPNPAPPAVATSPEPQNGEALPALDSCADDNGTAITSDDVTHPCLQWKKVEGIEFQDVIVNGSLPKRTRLNCLQLIQSNLPGVPHTWQVKPSNAWASNSQAPIWSFEIRNFCAAPASAKNYLGINEKACGSAPTVLTQPALGVSQVGSTLSMLVDPNDDSTNAWFEWGSTSSLGFSTPLRAIGSGSTAITISQTLSGLNCDTTYHFRARAQNAFGSAVPGQTRTFRTLGCGGAGSQSQPLLTNGDFENGYTSWITSNSFFIGSQPCPYSGSKYAFLALSDGTRADNLFGFLDQVVAIPAGSTNVSFTYRYSIETVDPSTEPKDIMTVWVYNASGTSALALLKSYSNLNARNGCGSSFYNPSESFNLSSYAGQTIRLRFLGTTDSRTGTPTVFRIDAVNVSAMVPQASAPEVTTGDADQVNSSNARLGMTVDPNGKDTTVWFDLEAEDSTPDEDTEHISVGNGAQPVSVSLGVFDLECNTTYYFRAHAENDLGSPQGVVHPFITGPCSGSAPFADTDPAESITQTSATLTADVDPNGLPTQGWFAWGSSPDLGQETPHVSIGSGTGNVDFSQILTGLQCGTTYYFENHAANATGQDDGATLEFTTAACGAGGGSSGHPMIGLWRGTIAGYNSELTITRSSTGVFSARVSMDQANQPIEDLTVVSVTETSFLARRPLDNNAELQLVLTRTGSQECLVGQYVEHGSGRPISLCREISTTTHPMVGLWRGTIAGYASDLTVARSAAGVFTALVSMVQANQPVENLTVVSVTETNFLALRPLDHNAELRLSLIQTGGGECLIGEYVETGTSRPISLCRGSSAPHPLVGLWRGTIASYPSDLTISQSSTGAVFARVSIAQANQSVEDLTVVTVTATSFLARRPLDNNSELQLVLTQVGATQCLNGYYVEAGTSRPISLCRTP